jgi:hypothetical protein
MKEQDMHDDEALTDGSGSDPLSTISRGRRRGVKVTAAAIMALGLAVGGGAVAGATTSSSTAPSGTSTHPGGRPFGGSPPVDVGTVKSVGTDSFTLTTSGGTVVTVDVGTSTTYRDRGVTSPTIADLKVGDHVAVFGTDTSDTVTATSVAIGDLGGPGGPGGPGGSGTGPGGSPPAAVGTVKAVGTDSFTLTTSGGTVVTVDVGTSTTYRDPGVTSATFADVKVGDHVAVFGTDTSNTVTATSVGVGDFPGGRGGPGGGGKGAPAGGGEGGPPSGSWSS